MRRALGIALAALLAAACSSRGPRPYQGSGSIDDEATTSFGPRDPDAVACERAMRDLRWVDAEALLERAGGVDPAALERSWLLLDLWRARCAEDRAKDAVAALQSRADGARVLLAHVAGAPADRLRIARPALSGPAAGWANLESALALEEEGEQEESARMHATRALALGPAFVRREALLLLGRLALERGAVESAARIGERGAALDPEDPRFSSLRSVAAARRGDADAALRFAALALTKQPKSSRAARRVADALRERPSATAEREAEAALSATLAAAPSGEALAVAAILAENRGDRATAVRRYEEALARDASPVPIDRRLRRLLFAAGRRAEAVALLRKVAPPEALTNPRNRLQPGWAVLERAGKGPVGADELAQALVSVGALEEARAVLLASPTSTSGERLAARLASQLAFERALRDECEEGYRRKACDGPCGDLGELFARLTVLARRHLPAEEAEAFARPAVGVRTVPFLGAWLDTSVETASPAVAHFRRYGKFLVVGQRTGQPPEIVLLSLASLEVDRDIRTQGHRFAHDVAIGYDREARSYLDFRGGALSGACLPDGVWLDADSSRREEHATRLGTKTDPVLEERLARAAAHPPRGDGIEGPFSLEEPACLALRLERRYLARGGDGWGAFRALAAHEFGHVLDLDRHLPVAKGLPETLGVLFGQGLSLGRVEAFLEGRAQRAAVMDAPDPDLALADMVRSLPLRERSPGAHDRGYRDQVAKFVRHVHRNASRYPAVDVSRAILPQLDRLSNEELRQLARAVAGS